MDYGSGIIVTFVTLAIISGITIGIFLRSEMRRYDFTPDKIELLDFFGPATFAAFVACVLGALAWPLVLILTSVALAFLILMIIGLAIVKLTDMILGK